MKTPLKRSMTAARKASAQEPNDDRMVILVRRGALRRFDALTHKTKELPVVISWDRRQNDRRRAATKGTVERRNADRRQPAPFTWELADFVVLPGGTFDGTNGVARAAVQPEAAPVRPRPKAASRKPVLKAVRRSLSKKRSQK